MHISALNAIAELEDSYWWFVAKNRIIAKLVETHAPGADIRSLDVGCGPGGMLQVLDQRGGEAIGVDIADEALEFCRQRGLTAVKGALPGDMPFEPGSFDLIVASEVIEHVEDDDGAVRTLHSLLRPGGVLIATVPAFQWMWTAHDTAHHHFRRYTTARFGAMLEGAGFQRRLLSYYNTTFFPLMVAQRAVSRVRGAMGASPESMVEIKPLPKPVNAVMTSLFEFEGSIVPRVPLPVGGSIIGVFHRAE